MTDEAGRAGAKEDAGTAGRAGAGGPLAGLRVIEICNVIAGPVCARLLGDFGADVIKIESADGDGVRQSGKHVGDVSLNAASILRNKRCISLDLKAPEGLAIARKLIDGADILIENNRPGVMERLGLGYAELSASNPRLVMVRISGYGQDGPYADRPGYGVICEAFGGVRHMTGDPDRPPARVALATTDYLTAIYAAFGAMVAIEERHRTGRGQVVDAALYETAFTQMESYVPAFEKLGFVPARVGSGLPTMAPNNLYPTRDGAWILIAANNNPVMERLVRAMGRPELLADERFATIRSRGIAQNIRALDAIIGEWTVRHDGAALEAMLNEAEVPNSRAFTIADIFADAHYRARDMLVEVPHATLGHTTQIGVVPKLSRTPGAIRRSGPDLGADSRQVLGEMGLTSAQVDELVARGIVNDAPRPTKRARAGS